ncbi:flagellar hook-length control protein FliK [Pseudoalteromonas sp. S16_S37]|uniref:flagellar hook-length control protein FliK n=1 Tax=Pseudoalteromonas sp. S16_S37 TaxID=2720228 RepID=UPI001681558B|nr:flagellar hook-length control protein FliK [Pseudoalteromonas sp. S16_S37]MBD1582255.1 flagellar hook-length control protein FliK [Pseudoalteromonas sp. S16_S37]
MNKPPISIQYSTTTDANAALNEGRANNELSKQPSQFTARNVQIKPGSLQMEVEIDGRWQTIRLATKEANQPTLRLNEAQITLSDNGQSLTIKSADQVINIKAANELLSLLTLLKGGVAESSLSTQAKISSGNNPQLLLEKIGIKLALDPTLAKILSEEHKLVAQLQASESKVQLKLFNGFADLLFSSVLSKQKIAEQLTLLGKSPQILVDKHAIQIKFSATQKPLSVSIGNLATQPQAGPVQWQNAKLQSNIQGVQIATLSEQFNIDLKQSIKGKFDQVSQFVAPQQASDPLKTAYTLNYPKPIFSITFQDIKKAVEQALNQWLSKPFKQVSPSHSSQIAAPPSAIQSLSKYSDTPLMLQRIETQNLPPLVKLMAQLKSILPSSQIENLSNSLITNLPQSKARIVGSQGSLPQANAQGLVKSVDKSIQAAVVNQAANGSSGATDKPLPNLVQTNNAFKASLPIERALLEPLLKLLNKTAVDTPKLSNTQILSEKVAQLSQYKHPQSVDMTKLVHQAFSRMIDANNVSGNLIASELNALVPGLINTNSAITPNLLASSFTQVLDKLIVTLLAAPKAIATSSKLEGSDQTQRLTALLETLLPNAKSVSAKQLLPHLQQLNSNLLGELSQLQNSFSSSVQVTQTSTQKVDSETQLLLNLLMPMKVPPECKQTELQIGNYKKPAKAKMPEKTVWFVRLNFDYAHLGKLSAHAELMDKALDCEIIGNSEQVCDLAKPHLDALRRKLCAHGLQVNEIVLTEDAEQQYAFYEQHAIVNIKV